MRPYTLTAMVLSGRNLSWDISLENVVETLHRAGGSLESRLVMCHFMAGRNSEKLYNQKTLNNLSGILDRVAVVKKDSEEKTVWILKKEFMK